MVISFPATLLLTYLLATLGLKWWYTSPFRAITPTVPIVPPSSAPAFAALGSAPALIATSYTTPSNQRVVCPRDRSNSQGLNLRQSPGVSAPILSLIPCNASGIQVFGKSTWADGEWWLPVQYQSTQGWVVGRFLAE